MFHRQSRSTFFWALGSKVKGKAEETLLNIDVARFRKSISVDSMITEVARGGGGVAKGRATGNGRLARTKYGRNVRNVRSTWLV
jgi:hypothetical protein